VATAAIEARANLPALTGLRGVAAWFVVLFHIRTGAATQLPDWLIHIFSKGYLAVDLFFMLSGFVLWLNYAHRLREHGAAGVPQFLARRLARIWPLHLFILACTVALAALFAATGRASPGHYPWSELPLHVVLAQNWGFTSALTWNDPSWSISCEFAAYLLFPLLVALVDWRRLPTPSLLLPLALLPVTLHALMAGGGATTLGTDIPRFGLSRALIEFLMGTVLCTLWSRGRARPVPALLGCSAVLVLVVPLLLLGLVPETLGVPWVFAALLLAVALGWKNGNPLASRPVHYLGEISYATYLVHFLLYKIFKLAFVTDPARVPLPLLGLFLLLVLAASIALHHQLERPAQRRLNRAIDGWRPAPHQAVGRA
jgi:peptidoglycan/LPS O-acetylase OafA/YrhL